MVETAPAEARVAVHDLPFDPPEGTVTAVRVGEPGSPLFGEPGSRVSNRDALPSKLKNLV
jgi:hypothetical protein